MESFTGEERSSGPPASKGRDRGSCRRPASNMQPEAPNGRGFEVGEIADALPY
jgi:hypothetical protein